MPTESVPMTGWTNGIDNRSRAGRLPEGFVRDLLNLDPGPTLRSRVGYEKVADASNCRKVIAFRNRLLFVDGATLKEVRDGAVTTVYTGIPPGPVAHCIHNNELFLSTFIENLRYDGQEIRPWGVPTPTQVSVSGGASTSPEARPYLFAVTFVNEYGEEGGSTVPQPVSAKTFTVSVSGVPSGYRARVYVSNSNGAELYMYREINGSGSVSCSPGAMHVTSGALLTTMGYQKPPVGSHLASRDGVILIANGSTVYFTSPMSPHIVESMAGFFQYPKEVTMLLSGLHGVYVCSDKCYKLSGVSGDRAEQSSVMDYPAIPGTGTTAPNGEAVWLTRYGMAIESRDPREGVSEVSTAFYVGDHEQGASGVVEHDGRRRLVSTARRANEHPGLTAGDYFEAEVIRP